MREPRGGRLARALPLLAWLLLAGLTTYLLAKALHDPVGPGQPLPDDVRLRHLADFRDTVWLPARDLVAGHDPYAPFDYVARHPGSQEFDLYAPWHLVLALPFAAVPFRLGGAAWVLLQVAAAVGIGMLLAVRVGWPRRAAVPLLALGALAVLPGRSSVVGGQSTLLVVLGVAAALLVDPRRRPWLAAAGLVLALTKPQFGLPVLVVLLVLARWQLLARAAVLATGLGLPVVVAATAAEGSPARFLTALSDNLDYAGSAAVGISFDLGETSRLDWPSLLARARLGVPSTAAQLLLGVVLCAALGLLLRHRAQRGQVAPADRPHRAHGAHQGLADTAGPLTPTAVAAVAAADITLFVHQYYDALLLVVPLVLVVAATLRRPSVPGGLLALACAVPVLHPRRVDPLVWGAPVSFGASAAVDAVGILALLVLATTLLAVGAAQPPASTSVTPQAVT